MIRNAVEAKSGIATIGSGRGIFRIREGVAHLQKNPHKTNYFPTFVIFEKP